MIAETGIRKIADDQVDLSFFQKFYTADGSTVGDFDANIRERLMKMLEVMIQIITADRVTGTDTELSLQHIVSGKRDSPSSSICKAGLTCCKEVLLPG